MSATPLVLRMRSAFRGAPHALLIGALLVLCGSGIAAASSTAGAAPLSAAEERRNERIDRFLLASMRRGDLDAWVVLSREGNFDPLSADLGFYLGRAALVFVDVGDPRVERLALVSSLDLVPLRESGIYDRVVGVERDESFEVKLSEMLAGLEAERIGVNMSAANGIADGLSASSLELLRRALGEERASRIVSAETAVLSFRSKKLPSEVELYRRAAEITRQVLEEALTDGWLRPGETTQTEMRDHVQAIAARRGFAETGWERESCPGVYSGLFTDLSHAEPGARTIDPGDILWLDFGIRYEGYATDMIRAAYLLRPGETAPPEDVQRMFDTARRANRAAAQAMRPGVFGWEVDAAARRVVTAAGFPEFFHAAGHPVGVEVHDAGPSLGPRSPKYGSAVELTLEPGQIFAVEPSVMQPREDLGGSFIVNIEEEVVVTEDGGVYLAPPQEELYLIPAPEQGR